MTAREEILARIRGALQVQASDPAQRHSLIAREYARSLPMSAAQRLELFRDRLLDYDTEVLEAASYAEIPSAIAQSLANAQENSLLAAPEFPREWLPPGIAVTLDEALPHESLNRERTVVTTCEAAVASTGTIFLVHRGSQGRRVLTLLPDHHLCIVRRDQVYGTLPEAIAAVVPHAAQPITTISGPSATSDIEMVRIRGVHGPRRLTVILAPHA